MFFNGFQAAPAWESTDMGNHIPNISLISTPDTWLEGNAVRQLETTAHLPAMRRVAGMPDLHAGRGYPIGAAFFSVGRFYPALIGGDIGCGMAFWQTAIPAKLAKQIGNIDAPLGGEWQARIKEILPDSPFQAALGTIGGGNHFAELQTVDTVYRAELLPDGFRADALQLLVHSGSRGDYSYLAAPAADTEAALNSLAHGAGRKWQRGECKGRLSHKYSADSLRRTAFGSLVICADKALVYEEAPQAYKNIDSIIAAMHAHGLIELVARFKPVLTYKTGGECAGQGDDDANGSRAKQPERSRR